MRVIRDPRALCNIRDPSKTHLKPKSRENLFAHSLYLSHPIILKFCTEHDSIIVVLCTRFQRDWKTEIGDMNEWGFARFEALWWTVCKLLSWDLNKKIYLIFFFFFFFFQISQLAWEEISSLMCCSDYIHGPFSVYAQPMREDVTLWHHLSLAGCIHEMIPVYLLEYMHIVVFVLVI